MSVIHTTYLVCDGTNKKTGKPCGATFGKDMPNLNIVALRAAARLVEWHHNNDTGADTCGVCRPRKRDGSIRILHSRGYYAKLKQLKIQNTQI